MVVVADEKGLEKIKSSQAEISINLDTLDSDE
jgi:hypothetical protein